MTIYGYCIDSSEDAERALRWGLRYLPPREEDTVYCVTVLEPPVRLTAGGTTIVDFSTHSPDDVRRIEAVGEGLLSRFVGLAEEFGARRIKTKVIVPEEGASKMPAASLSCWAEEANVDVLIAGRHREHATIKSMVGLGSQTTWLTTNNSKIPLLSVPHEMPFVLPSGGRGAAQPASAGVRAF